MDNTPNNQETQGFAQDQSIDLTQFVKADRAHPVEEPKIPEEKPAEITQVDTAVLKPAPVTSTPTTEMSPLEKMRRAQQSATAGMVVSNEEYKKGLENTEKTPIAYNDTRMNAINDSILEMDETMRKRKCVVIINQPETESEYTQMMLEIDSVQFTKDGPKFNFLGPNDKPAEPKFVRLRTAEDPTFEEEMDAKNKKLGLEPKTEEELNKEVDDAITYKEDGSVEINPLKNPDTLNTIDILIDKTGLGVDFIFTEEEKEKLIAADQIRVKEIEQVVLPMQIVEKKDLPATTMEKEVHAYQLSGAKYPVCFPASGFSAEMRGLSYGEMADVAVDPDLITAEKYRKRFSVIYNSMLNLSCSPFKDFEDFLKNFAYADIPMALFGSYRATNPEINQLQLRCNVDSCRKGFTHKFNTRSLLRFEQSSPLALEKHKELTLARPSELDGIYKRAAVRNAKIYQMPYSGYRVAVGQISCYDYLYKVLPVMDPERFQMDFPDDPNGTNQTNSFLLLCIPALYKPVKDGWEIIDDYKEMINTLYNFSPVEIKLLFNLARKILHAYDFTFSLGQVTCPHCKAVTPNLTIDMDTMVFQTYQLLMNTEIDVSSLQVL